MFRANLFIHYQAVCFYGKTGRHSERVGREGGREGERERERAGERERERERQTDRQDEVHRFTFTTFLMDAPQVRHFHSEFPIYYY